MEYIYKDETNQLGQIRDSSPSDWWDGEMTNQLIDNYVYDAIGQLVESNQDDLEIEYDVYGKVKTLKQKSTGEIKAEYFYNEAGFRVKKIVHPSPTVSVTTHYVRDNSGTVLSIYEDTTQAEVPIYGSGRLGVYYKAADQTVYELSDHLGNVRTTFIDNNGTAEQQSFADYYPFGWKLPGRNQQGAEGYRYGYQGQFSEEDKETGWNQFELRMWDGRIGRWMTTDPANQYPSPYLGMGNNPLNAIDRDGAVASSPIYDSETGDFLGVDSEGFTGDVVLMNRYSYDYLTNGGTEVLDHSVTESLLENGFAQVLSRSIDNLLFERIANSVVADYELANGKAFSDHANVYAKSRLATKIATYGGVEKINGSWMSKVNDHGFSFEYTVENMRSTYGDHELYGHGFKNWVDENKSHRLVYKHQMNRPIFQKTTKSYKKNIYYNYIDYHYRETGETAPRFYYNQYYKYGGSPNKFK